MGKRLPNWWTRQAADHPLPAGNTSRFVSLLLLLLLAAFQGLAASVDVRTTTSSSPTSGSNAKVGSAITFTATTTNPGGAGVNNTASGVIQKIVITNIPTTVLEGDFTVSGSGSGSATFSRSGTTVTWTFGAVDLAVNATALSASVAFDAPDVTSVGGQASSSLRTTGGGVDTDIVPLNNTGSTSTINVVKPDVTTTTGASQPNNGSIVAGYAIAFSTNSTVSSTASADGVVQKIVITNAPATTAGFTNFPANATYSYSNGTGTVTFNARNLPAGGQQSEAVEFNPQAAGTITAQASSTSTDIESNTANNTGALITIFVAPAPAPSISGFTPTSGAVGQTVTISGNNLANASAITFNGQSGAEDDVTVVPNAGGSNTSVSVTLPAGVTFGTISVKTPGGVATSTQTFTPPFALIGFKPANNALTVARNASVVLNFSQNVPTASAAAIRVFSSQVGSLSQARVAVNNNVVTITPAPFFFKPGEVVNVVVPNTVLSATGQAVSNPQTFDFTVITANGTAVFSGTMEKVTNANPANEVLGDVDGDGKLDLIVTNYGNGSGTTISILRNIGTNGTPDFAAKQDFAVAATGPYNIAIGDVDGDGKLDVVTCNDGSANVSVLRNTGTGVGSISFATAQLFTVGTTPSGLFIGDIDGDAKQDLVTANQGTNNVSVLRNTSTGVGNIAFAAKTDFAVGATPYGVAIGDMDEDGKQDIITVNSGANTISVLRNLTTGPGAIVAGSFATKADFATAGSPVTLAVGDLDGDGEVDVVTSNNTGNNVSVLRNTSTGVGNIAFAAKVDFTVGTGPAGIALGDLNSDGKLDIVTSDYGSSGTTGGGTTVSIRLNQTTGVGAITAASFGARSTVTVGSGPNNVLLGDLDGDGDLDIVTANQGGTGNTTSIRINATSAAPQPLPVELISFVAQAKGSVAVQLDWATAQEKSNAGFIVERSTDAKHFTELTYVTGQGTSTVRHNYTWLDEKLPASAATLYYRLRQLDSDGTATYSPIRTVSLGAMTTEFQVFPTNSVDGKLRYSFRGTAAEDAFLDIYTLTGQHLRRHAVGTLQSGAVSVADLMAGGYIVRYTSAGKSYSSRFFVH